MKFLNWCQSFRFVSGVFLVLIFLGALFWAREQDPFSRKWFTLKTTDGNSFKCVAVLPKPIQRRPVILYAHGSGGKLMNDGYELRQMAELGLAVVSLDYDETNEAAFAFQFESLINYLGRQNWVDTNAIVWAGFSLGANRILDFARQHPKQTPQALFLLNGSGIDISTTNCALSTTGLHVLLIHGEQDEVFPLVNMQRLASVLQANGVPVESKTLPGLSHSLDPERGVVFRSLGEYCRSHSVGKWENYYSIAQWRVEAPSLWLFWTPAIIWIFGCFIWWWWHKSSTPKAKLTRWELALRWLAAALGIWALTETAIHLVTPHFPVSDTTLGIARRFLIPSKEHADFETLATQPVWKGEKLKALLNHVALSGYNRQLINWQLDDKIYQDYVLSPVIEISTNSHQLPASSNWRRPLWEEFYPRIRRESSPEAAAKIIVRHLRERVTIASLSNPSQDVPNIWLKQVTDRAGFEMIYVAALRSVGVPARLDSNGHAEFYDGDQWKATPLPSVISW